MNIRLIVQCSIEAAFLSVKLNAFDITGRCSKRTTVQFVRGAPSRVRKRKSLLLNAVRSAGRWHSCGRNLPHSPIQAASGRNTCALRGDGAEIMARRRMPVEETIAYCRPAFLPEVEIWTVDNSQRCWTVFHEYYTICTVRRFPGRADWSYRQRTHRTLERELMLMEPGEVHRTLRVSAPGSFDIVRLGPPLMKHIAQEIGFGSRPHFKCAGATHADLFQAFVRFHDAVSADETPLHCQSLLIQSVALLLERCGEESIRQTSSISRTGLRQARDYLHAYCDQKVELGDLARLANLSQFHFLRAFARKFGLPPHAYQINLRVQRACAALRAGVPGHEIAVGFADQSHLIRHFKRLLGVTPARYASMMGARHG